MSLILGRQSDYQRFDKALQRKTPMDISSLRPLMNQKGAEITIDLEYLSIGTQERASDL